TGPLRPGDASHGAFAGCRFAGPEPGDRIAGRRAPTMTERKLKWVVYAVLLHLALLGLLIIGFQWSRETAVSRPAAPEPIQATVVDAAALEQQAAKLRAAEEKQRQAELERQRRIKAEQARLEKLQREREAAEKAAAEKVRQQKLAAERKARAEEAARQKAEAQRQAEAERKAREAAEQQARAEREAQMQANLAAEERARERAEAAALAQYKTSIAQKVERNWIAPASVPAGLSCKVEVMQLPGGIVAGEPKIVAGECNTTDPLVLQSII